MFDLDVPVGARFTKAGGIGQRMGAVLIQAAQELGMVTGGHGEEQGCGTRKRE
ncbi:hypothetical protein [Cupriavidus sp. AcVe19-1a]|uniref:hypothetical protein n=1 Tax=Cupriavidus sp. AcVe19-1a TaxID=2821359 RepID=UPI0032AEADB0